MPGHFPIFSKSKNSFDGQRDDERVILLLRRHPFVIIIRLAGVIFLVLLPIFIIGIYGSYLIDGGLLSLSLFALSIWYLLLWQVAWYALTLYSLDVWIVTNRRIIDSTQHGYFNRTISEIELSRIQDISVNTSGFIPTLLHYGNLEVQSAGAENKFMFKEIPNPEDVKDVIVEQTGIKGFKKLRKKKGE
jgi:uncharacterized membrane protein YdbT with pleckstrin-like domain